MSLLTRSRPTSIIETSPLLGVVIGVALGALPLAPRVVAWVIVVFFASCISRLIMNRPGSRLPSGPVKMLLFGLGVGGVGLTYGSMVGIDPGLSILLVLVSLKLIEADGERDFHVLALLGFFLALCDLFFSQDLLVWFYVAFIAVLLTATLVRFYRGSGAGSYRRSTGLALTMFAQALPVIALLFVFFPRVYGGFRFQFSQSLLASGGMSNSLTPGSFASLALSSQPAFRADFPDGNLPPMSALYWRGGVLWQGDGLSWDTGSPLLPERRIGQLAGVGVRQRISLEPHGGKWLFALDRPGGSVRNANFRPGSYVQSQRAITSKFFYDVVSFPEYRETGIPPDQRIAATRLPKEVSPRVRALVDGWKKESPDPRDIVDAALNFFRRERFTYTLTPGTYESAHALDEFLFERRQGFCEHYAASFATLMRVAGIPSRVIIGYHGGEFNTLGHYVIVRQSDAHAWCEVWLKDIGWQRMDPTDMIAPERISAGLASYLETQATQNPDASRLSVTATGWREVGREIQRNLRLAWDTVNYQWDMHVLNFDEETQRNFLFSLGLGAVSWPEILIWVGVVVALILALLTMYLRRPGHTGRDEIGEAYARFCRMLERAGLRREPWEGPQDFGERAATRFAAQAGSIREVTALYIQARYGAGAPALEPLTAAVRRLPKIAATTSGT